MNLRNSSSVKVKVKVKKKDLEALLFEWSLLFFLLYLSLPLFFLLSRTIRSTFLDIKFKKWK